MNASNLKHWLSRGELDKLENVVLEGRGARLLGEQSPDLRTRVFLKGLPNYLTKISQIHDAVVRGSLLEVIRIVEGEPKKKLVIAKDPAGTPLIHKAVYYDHQNVVEWIVDNYPVTVDQKDRENRTALHYCAACADPESVWDILIEAGCDASICDKRGNPAAYYLQRGAEIELPDPERMPSRRLRTRDSGWTGNSQYSGRNTSTSRNTALDFKPSNIRIWIHNRDIGKLQQVLWEGHGSKLRCETSNNVRVKRFLEAVPFIMGTIKDIHSMVIKNDVDGFRKKVEDPVSSVILCSKDSNGLNVLHKAAGLGYVDFAREILDRYPSIVNAQDNDGRTPLHYAAVCRDGGVMCDILSEYGGDEVKLDNRQKTAAFYKNRPSDIDLTSLVMVPEAPRVSGGYPRHWDWRIIDSDQPLPRIKRTGNNVDDDSAFGSAESAKLTEDVASPETENAEEELNGNEEAEMEKGDKTEADEPIGDAVKEKNVTGENKNPTPEAKKNGEGEARSERETENRDEGEKYEEPQVVTLLEIVEPETDDQDEEQPQQKAAEVKTETLAGEVADKKVRGADEEDIQKAEKDDPKPENEAGDKAEPSTADSGVGHTPNGEEQVIEANDEELAGEEEAEAEAEAEAEEEEEEEEEEAEEGEPEYGSEEAEESPGEPADEEEEEVVEIDDADEEASELVENGSMEQLAALVLTGEGHRLIGRHSSNPELQAFIDNVPSYMKKIRSVHRAAREGNLKDLQIALDRRKFAIAKDRLSPHGATPLHVAVIFGHTTVVRYLGGRFPETVHALDLDGRTPLHYAATLNDNGHYYNLLLHLGANPLVQDNFGQKADYYKQNQDDLSHKQLLLDFGAPESLADEMLTDKVPGGDKTSARRDVSEPETLATLERCFRLLTSGIGGNGPGAARRSSVPMTPSTGGASGSTTDHTIFQDEEGRYLASSLGDPLIKGLTEVATARPKDPVTYLATYLYNFANKDKPADNNEETNILIIPEEEEEEEEENAVEKMQENGNEAEGEEDDDGYPQSPDLDAPESLFTDTERDENGQTWLHFAADRSHSKNGLYHLLQEMQINVAFRDARYRTGRDVAESTGKPENVQEIDKFVVYLAARGETDKLMELLMEGYDHILDTRDDNKNVLQIAREEENTSTVAFLESIENYTKLRDEIHSAIRARNALKARELMQANGDGARLLALGKNSTGRCSLHIAVLCELEDAVRYIAKTHPETLQIGDNLERTALHYAMGVPSVEAMSGILIKAGAKRVQKDLKSRQPSYYFMNKSDIEKLQREEEAVEN